MLEELHTGEMLLQYGGIGAALAWALYELHAQRRHKQALEEDRLELEREVLEIQKDAVAAQQAQARAQARLADHVHGNGLELEQDLKP